MLVNICGPPGSGKSLYSEQFAEEHPEFVIVSIDDYRRKFHSEEQSWHQVMIDTAYHPNCILESSGTSWRLEAHILSRSVVLKRGILTIICYGDRNVFSERLKDRNKAEVPFRYKGITEEGLIAYASGRLPQMYPTAFYLMTDGTDSKEETYRQLKEKIISEKKKLDRYLVK